MVSKSRKQRQIQKAKRAVGDNEPQKISTGKSVHLKRVRPNMKSKMKIRMGHESSDIYEGFENSKQVNWSCPTCGRIGRVVGFCITCEAEKIAVRDELKQKKTTTSSLVPAATQGVSKAKAAKTAPKK